MSQVFNTNQKVNQLNIANMSSQSQQQQCRNTQKGFKAGGAVRDWAFATNSRNENGIVLCIPRVFANITKQRVFACMCNTGWGQIDRVDLIKCGSYQKAYIHFVPNGWACGSDPEQVLRRLQVGESVVFTYDVNPKHPEGWFWKISISTALNPKFRPPRVKRRKTIDWETSAEPFIPSQVTDDMLLERKNSNQQAIRDDPIASRQREHAAAVAVAVAVAEEQSKQVSDEDLEEFSGYSEQAATFMAQKKKYSDDEMEEHPYSEQYVEDGEGGFVHRDWASEKQLGEGSHEHI